MKQLNLAENSSSLIAGGEVLKVEDVLRKPDEDFYNTYIWKSNEKLFGPTNLLLSEVTAFDYTVIPPDISGFGGLFTAWLEAIKRFNLAAPGYFPSENDNLEFASFVDGTDFFKYNPFSIGTFTVDAARSIELSRTGDVSTGEFLQQDSTPDLYTNGLGLRPVFIDMDPGLNRPLPHIPSSVLDTYFSLGWASTSFMSLLKNYTRDTSIAIDAGINRNRRTTDTAEQVLQFVKNGHISTLEDGDYWGCENFLPGWFDSIERGGYEAYWEDRFKYDPYGLTLHRSSSPYRNDLLVFQTSAGQRVLQEIANAVERGLRLVGFSETLCSFTCNPDIKNAYLDSGEL